MWRDGEGKRARVKIHLIWTFGGENGADLATDIRSRWLAKHGRGEPIRLRRC